MSSAVERLTRLVDKEDRYDIPHSELRAVQIEAINERFQQRKDQIKLVAHRAREAGIEEVRSLEDVVKLLLPHTAYKSYPENFLLDKKWAHLAKWLNTVSSYPIEGLDASALRDIDDFIEALEKTGHYVSCSSGTTGKSAMLPASAKDMDWVQREMVSMFSWGSGIKPANDRRMVSAAPVAHVPRNVFVRKGMRDAYGDPNKPSIDYPVPPITIGQITGMVAMRKAIAAGTARPADIAAFEETSAKRQKALSDAIGILAEKLAQCHQEKIHFTGMWAGIYDVARAVRDMGYGPGDKKFHPENSMFVGGGLKGASLPPNYQDFIRETFNISPKHCMQMYGMQELHTGMPKCEKGRYHVPPWLVPLILDETGDSLLPIVDGRVEGRAAFFDLAVDGRWGGVISGDKVCVDYNPCACGSRSPSILDNVVRYADLKGGDDKITCAGTIDAYVKGIE